MFRPTEIGKLLKYIIFHVNGRNITLIPRHVSKIRRNTSLKFLMLLKGGGEENLVILDTCFWFLL